MFTIHPSSLTALPAPQVTITPSGSSTAGSPYTLTCTVMVVNGLVVVPQVMWLTNVIGGNGAGVAGGNGILVTSGMASANTTNLTLQFNPLHTSNGGQYSCIANVSIPIISITSLYTTSAYNVTVQSKFVPRHMISTAYTLSVHYSPPSYYNLHCCTQPGGNHWK